MAATISMSAVVSVRAVAGQQRGTSAAGRPAFMGRPAAGVKASLGDAFSAMSLNTPARKQAQRGLSICGALHLSLNTHVA